MLRTLEAERPPQSIFPRNSLTNNQKLDATKSFKKRVPQLSVQSELSWGSPAGLNNDLPGSTKGEGYNGHTQSRLVELLSGDGPQFLMIPESILLQMQCGHSLNHERNGREDNEDLEEGNEKEREIRIPRFGQSKIKFFLEGKIQILVIRYLRMSPILDIA
eukprot:gene23757-biopygen9615